MGMEPRQLVYYYHARTDRSPRLDSPLKNNRSYTVPSTALPLLFPTHQVSALLVVGKGDKANRDSIRSESPGPRGLDIGSIGGDELGKSTLQQTVSVRIL